MMGHNSVHQGLQNHSIGAVYPLAVVGYGKDSGHVWGVEDLRNGTVACFVGPYGKFYRYEFLTAQAAEDLACEVQGLKVGNGEAVEFVPLGSEIKGWRKSDAGVVSDMNMATDERERQYHATMLATVQAKVNSGLRFWDALDQAIKEVPLP